MVENGLSPIRFEFDSAQDAVIIAFGSLRLETAVPPFEWGSVLRSISASHVLVRDLTKLWYLRGLPGLSTHPLETRDYLRSWLDQQQITKVITIGGSMGGYAALLYGALLGANEVHAFGAQTFLPARKGKYFWKSVYSRQWAILRKQTTLLVDRSLDRSYYDLRNHLQHGAQKGVSFHLYFCEDNGKDVQHAHHVAGIQGVTLHGRVSGGHHISTVMRDSGELATVLNDALLRLGSTSSALPEPEFE